MFKPSFYPSPVSRNSRPDFPMTGKSLPSLGGITSKLVVLPDRWLGGLYASRNIFPLGVSPRPDIQESLFLLELGLVVFYYSLAYRWFDLGEWLCFSFVGGVYSQVGMFYF